MELQLDIRLTEGQQKAYDAMHDPLTRYLICAFSRQCGKSVLSEILLMENLLRPKTFNAYISPTFALSRKVFKELCALLSQTPFVASANSSTLTITTTQGSTLQFFSTESPVAIRGNTVSGILVLDEAAYMPDVLPNGELLWANVILPITKARKPKVLMISTPHGKSGFFYEHYLRGLEGAEGYVSMRRDIYQDSLVSEEEIGELKASMPEMAWRQEFLVEFIEGGSSVFTDYGKCFDTDSYTPSKCWIGIDLSSQGSDNTVVTLINDKDEVKQYVVKGTLDEKYARMADIINDSSPVAVYMEANSIGTPIINEVKKLVRHKSVIREWQTTNATKESIISDLVVEVAKHNIHFERDNRLLMEEMGTFEVEYSKTRKMVFKGRGSSHDDTIMSLAIALRCKRDFSNKAQIGFLKTFIPTNA